MNGCVLKLLSILDYCVGLLLRSFVVSTLVLDYSVSACFALDYSFVRSSWMIFVDSFLSFDSRQFPVCTCESASTVAIVVELSLCQRQPLVLVAAFWL